jgi:hypothetical protein
LGENRSYAADIKDEEIMKSADIDRTIHVVQAAHRLRQAFVNGEIDKMAVFGGKKSGSGGATGLRCRWM